MEYTKVDFINKPLAKLVLGTLIVNSDDLDKSFQFLDDAYDLGYKTLDTAHAYPSENAIGDWMKARGNRDDLVIITKGAHPNPDRSRVTPFDITSDLHDSLARLKTDYIDIYLLHRDDVSLPVGPLVDVLNEHYKAGRIKSFGGSNWTAGRIQEANEYAEANGLVGFTTSSPHFSLAEQVEEPWAPGCISISGPEERPSQAWYENSQMPVFSYSSLARGFFSGRVSREQFKADPDSIDQFCRLGYCYEQNFERLDRVAVLAKEKGVSIPAIALAFVLGQKMNVFPIVGAANRSELEANLSVVDLKLSQSEMDWIDLKSEQLA